MTRTALRTCTVAIVLAALGAGSCAPRQAPDAPPALDAPSTPKLIVQLAVDQFRADYTQRYGAAWTDGLRRLFSEGAVFTEAAYPYAGTVTCAGHASIGTGAMPADHGMVLNAWFDREQGRRRPCTVDETVSPVGFTKDASGRHSARWMMVPTFAERLDASQPADAGRVVALSLKARSAIGLAGHSGDAVVWFDGSAFATSSAYGKPAWAGAHLEAHPIEAQIGEVWTRVRPPATYQGPDADTGVKPPAGWTDRFPHPLSDGDADAPFYGHWQRSPYSDAYLADLAIAAIDALSLGRGDGTDYLGVSFSALDLVGHTYGPDSHEVQDVLARLDITIGRLLAHLDARVGRDNYVLAFTADHGVGPVPETMGDAGGRLPSTRIRQEVDGALDAILGAGDHVLDVIGTDVYLADASRARLDQDGKAVAELRRRLRALPAVDDVMKAAALAAARQSSDPIVRARGFSFYPGRSGDLLVVLRENFTSSTSGASHGTEHAYDRRVPVILFGSAFKTGTYDGPASPLDIAQTWARLTGITLEKAAGHSLDRAVK